MCDSRTPHHYSIQARIDFMCACVVAIRSSPIDIILYAYALPFFAEPESKRVLPDRTHTHAPTYLRLCERLHLEASANENLGIVDNSPKLNEVIKGFRFIIEMVKQRLISIILPFFRMRRVCGIS